MDLSDYNLEDTPTHCTMRQKNYEICKLLFNEYSILLKKKYLEVINLKDIKLKDFEIIKHSKKLELNDLEFLEYELQHLKLENEIEYLKRCLEIFENVKSDEFKGADEFYEVIYRFSNHLKDGYNIFIMGHNRENFQSRMNILKIEIEYIDNLNA
ncbi:MAG: hypothetical protein AABY22_21180 [Nanoarchaeota archaeon]